MRLYFIGGASGSGKTAVMPHLKELLGDSIAVYDFDDIGVPDGADKKWRGESTEKWLQKLLSEGKDACLLGQIVLGEILSCPSAKQIDKINFCLLDVSDFERIGRLKTRLRQGSGGQERNTDLSTEARRAQVDQNMLNWAAWLRMHTQDPQWAQHVVKEDCWNELSFSPWDQLEAWDRKAFVKIFDTTRLTINQVAESITHWIIRTNDQTAELIPNAAYKIIVDHTPSQADKNAVAESLVVDYERLMGQSRDKEFSVFLKNDSGEILGGIQAQFDSESVYLETLWVDQKLRKQGYGTKLINAAEQEAVKHGCVFSTLDTWDFQAEGFYLKNGYKPMGEIKKYWREHSRIFLRKVL